MNLRGFWIMLLMAAAGNAQQTPVQAQSPSTISYSIEDKLPTIEITNVSYEIVGQGIPGRPQDQRLVLRKTTRTRQVVDEIGMEASTTVDAWPLGVDLKQKPIYSLNVDGVDARTLNNEILEISRGLEEVEWWSVYKLGNGQRLFDTYTPLLQFSISREVQTLRYVGLEVPPDDTRDARLKAANVVAVLTYASAERVIREALITCDDPKQAALLRSYADSERKVTRETSGAIRISISQAYPSPANTIAVVIPVAKDDLDLAHAQAPGRVHVAAWKR
ncbi:MAG TPA: hypothetical protein VKR43_06525 [Bryobacteraceae bacterium]|nr:hypothetical protein [Bryobacteraceae bacterium]